MEVALLQQYSNCNLNQLKTELEKFELGRHLLRYGNLDGYWTDYITTYPNKQPQIESPLEMLLLNKFPTVIATQQRFQIFLQFAQSHVYTGAHLVSIPSGIGGELLYLNLQDKSTNLTLIDIDQQSLNKALDWVSKLNLTNVRIVRATIFDINYINQFTCIMSNGFTIYLDEDELVYKVYKQFFDSLKLGGQIITSTLNEPSNWNYSCISMDALQLEKKIFNEVLKVKWRHFRSVKLITDLLISAGFEIVEIIPDSANIFPSIIAEKVR